MEVYPYFFPSNTVIPKAIEIPEYLSIELREEWKSSLGPLMIADNVEEFIHTYSPTVSKILPKSNNPLPRNI